MTAWSSLVGVVILAGGASRRMGSDKLALTRDGVTLLDTVIRGVQEHLRAHGCGADIVVVGPRPSSASPDGGPVDVVFTREQPPGSGPLAAVAAGLERIDPGEVSDPFVIVLAGDAPAAPAAMPLLLAGLSGHESSGHELRAHPHDAAMLVDADDRLQALCAAYRLRPLRDALDDLGELDGRAMHDVLAGLSISQVPDTLEAADDIDTPDDARRRGFTDS